MALLEEMLIAKLVPLISVPASSKWLDEADPLEVNSGMFSAILLVLQNTIQNLKDFQISD